MLYLLIVIVIAVVAFVAFRSMGDKNNSQTDTHTNLPPSESVSQVADQSRAAPTPQRPAVEQPTIINPLSDYRPVGTPRLDDPDSVRPQLDATVIQSARSVVPSVLPEAVMADALLDTTPEQMRNLLSRAPESVIRDAFGSRDNVQRPQHKTEDLSQLHGMGDALDDLDIWSYGDKS